MLAVREIKISLDGESAMRENILIKLLVRTIKNQEVYLRA